jgi:1-acyl-sn-glycerol-3-phosphate acyltransferase
MSTVFFTIIGNAVLVVSTVTLGLVATVVGWLPPRGRWMYLCARIWSPMVTRTAGMRIHSHFAEPLSPKAGYVFMANHQSMMDIPVLIETLPGETRMLAKKGLFQIPIFGWSLKSGGFIPVDRKDRASARETFAAAVHTLEGGHSILLFPEETRSEDGELLPLKSGGFLMALKTGYPIVPVAITGTFAARPRGGLVNRPQRVEVRYGRPIAVRDYGVRRKKQLMEEVRKQLLELRGESS